MTADQKQNDMESATSEAASPAAGDSSPRERVGIFGGTFNPLHMAHLNVMTTVHGRLNLDKVKVVPAARNPNKPPVEGPSDEQRLEMLRRGLGEYDFIEIDDQEIRRGGTSYMVDTLRNYAKDHQASDLYLIVGMDQFEEFDQWKNFEEILTLANLVVVTRPKYNLPFSSDDLPAGVRKLVDVYDRQFIALSTGRTIEFIRLQDMDISATDVRKHLRTGRNVDRELSLKVEEYVREQGLYAPLGPKIGDYEEFTRFCARVLFDKKGIHVRGFDLRQTDSATEYSLIASGTSTRHASSLADAVQRAVKEEFNVFPQSIEGMSEGRWVLLDYGSLIVHVFYDFVRQQYRLEDLWKEGRDLELKDEAIVNAAPRT